MDCAARSTGRGLSSAARLTLRGTILAIVLSLGTGCAGLGGGAAPTALRPGADASPELSFLVGRELELDGNLDEALVAYQQALAADPQSIYLLRKLAELSARQNRIQDALGYAERAHAAEPDDLGIRLFLGTLYRFQKDVARAEEVLRDEQGEPVSPDAALLLYGMLADATRYSEAREIALWLRETEPEGLRGYFAVADVSERMGDAAGAEAALRDGLVSHPGDLSLYGALARARRDRGDREGEVEIHREVLVRYPEHHATQLALADALLDLERIDEAVAVLERVEAQHPGDLRSILRLGFLEFERRNYEEAARRFEYALAVNPGQHEVGYFLGIVRRRQRMTDEALATLDLIPPTHERYVEARTQIAAIHEMRGDYELAIEEVERAREAHASRSLDLYLASLRAKAGDQAGALLFLEQLLAESPDDPELLYNIGIIHGEAQEVDQALQLMERVLQTDPNHAGALNYVGYTWAERGTNLDRAEEYVSRALELRPDDGYITDSLGWIYYMRARPLLESGNRSDGMAFLERSVNELRRANELTGGDPVIFEHLGDAYLLLGEPQQALESYREALELGPRLDEQPELPGKLERLERELGDR
jgi:tetratricopeptide (TPR) repeat protein